MDIPSSFTNYASKLESKCPIKKTCFTPIKAILVRKKRGALRPQGQSIVDLGNESSSEEDEEEDSNESLHHPEGECSST